MSVEKLPCAFWNKIMSLSQKEIEILFETIISLSEEELTEWLKERAEEWGLEFEKDCGDKHEETG
jgi:DNA polymerase III delta subunit